LFDLYDSGFNNKLNLDKFVALLQEINNKITTLLPVSGSFHYPTNFVSVSLLVGHAEGFSTRKVP
jgi:hypothetical protein